MKIIFLDIDGVLLLQNINGYDFNLELVNNLKYILKETNALIVISSDRRYEKILLDGVFSKHNLKYIDTTRLDDDKYNNFTDKGLSQLRKEEILDYIYNNKESINKYCIIDDMNLNMNNFFKTEPNTGLSKEISSRIIDFLNN